MKFSVALIVFAFITNFCFGQTFSVSGSVFDATNEAIPGAIVIITKTSDSSRRVTQTNVDGSFLVANLSIGSYSVRIQSIGSQPHEQTLQISNQNIELGKIVLQQIQLKEVEIIGRIPPSVQKGDTTELNAAAFKTNPDASTEDLARKMPGVVITDGKVQAQGEDVKQVLVDGKPFFGDDPSATLKNLPAELVDKIQIYDDPGEQAKRTGTNDGNTSKTMNIITKQGMRKGRFGRIYGGYGSDSRYQAGATINIFNNNRRVTFLAQTNNINQQNFAIDDLVGMSGSSGGGRGGGGPRGGRGSGSIGDFLVGNRNGISTTHAFGVNYADKWRKNIDVAGSYFFNFSDNIATQDLHRQFVLARTSGQIYDESSNNTSQNINHRFNFRFDWQIDSMNTLLIRPRFSLQQNNGNSALTGITQRQNLLLNSTNNLLTTDLSGFDFSNDFLFTHRFSKKGRSISLNANTGLNKNDGNRLLLAQNRFLQDTVLFTDSLSQNAELLSNGWNTSSNITYTEPIGEFSSLNFSYTNYYQRTESSRETFDLADFQTPVKYLDTSLSNIFNSNYFTHRGGIGYRYNKDKFNTFIQANYQYAVLESAQQFPYQADVWRSFNNILPSAMFGYKISQSKNLRLFYRTSTNPPFISQLQNVIDNANPLRITTGNPDLKQDYRNNIFLRYSASNTVKSRSFFAMLGGEIARNYVGNNNFIALTDTFISETVLLPAGGQLITPVNLDGYYSLRSFTNYGMPLKFIKSNLNLNAHALYSRRPGLINGEINYSNSQTYGAGVVLSSNISEKIDFTISTNSSYNFVENTLQKQLNNTFFNQSSRFSLNWITWKNIVFNTELNHQAFSGLTGGFNQNYLLWNINVGKKFLKNNAGDLRLAFFDILKQNNSITRNVTEAYIEDVRTNVLQQYVMLVFTYNFRNFGASQTPPPTDTTPTRPNHIPGH